MDNSRGRVPKTHDQIAFVSENNQPQLPHLWEPPDKIKSRVPPIDQIDGAPKADRLGGSIEGESRPAVPRIQATCENCGETFEPRRRSGGKPQRFCSPACRKAFHVNGVPNVEIKDVPNTGQDVGDRTLVASPPDDEEDNGMEFRWNDENIVVPCQPPIAIYRNPSGGIVIRQDQTAFYGDDDWIVVLPENLPRLIRRLQEIERTGQ